MTIEQLDELAEQVKTDFLARIMELSNNEVEYVCELLRNYFDESLERLSNHHAAGEE